MWLLVLVLSITEAVTLAALQAAKANPVVADLPGFGVAVAAVIVLSNAAVVYGLRGVIRRKAVANAKVLREQRRQYSQDEYTVACRIALQAGDLPDLVHTDAEIAKRYLMQAQAALRAANDTLHSLHAAGIKAGHTQVTCFGSSAAGCEG